MQMIDQALKARVIAHVEHCTGETVPDIPWSLNNRLTAKLGRMRYRRTTMAPFAIEISGKAWPHFTEVERWTVLVHECCHALDPLAGHSWRWREWMRACDVSDAKYLDSPTWRAVKDAAAGNTVPLYCACPGPPILVSPRKAANMKRRGAHLYKCTVCREPARFTPVSRVETSA